MLLNLISVFMFNKTKHIIPNHYISHNKIKSPLKNVSHSKLNLLLDHTLQAIQPQVYGLIIIKASEHIVELIFPII